MLFVIFVNLYCGALYSPVVNLNITVCVWKIVQWSYVVASGQPYILQLSSLNAITCIKRN